MPQDPGTPAPTAPTPAPRAAIVARPVQSFAVLAGSDRANTGVLLDLVDRAIGALFTAAQFKAFAERVAVRRLELMRDELKARAAPREASPQVELMRDPVTRRVCLVVDDGAARVSLPLAPAQLRALHRSLERLGFGHGH